jgi:hypothetical protein
MKSAETDHLTSSYNRLPLSTAIETYRRMNPEEQAKAYPLLDGKVERGFATLPEAEQIRLMDKLERAGILH